MESILNLLSTGFSYIRTIGLADAVDILIVAYLIYKVINIVRKTNSRNVARGIFLLAVLLVLSYLFGLTMINFLLRRAMELGLIALVILFQPELRRLLERMGSTLNAGRGSSGTMMSRAISQTVEACTDMSASKTGALIVFERETVLKDISETGTIIQAEVSRELLGNLFYVGSPLHDGAVIIRGDKIFAAGCVLPLTENKNLNKSLGTRHRAGIGITENSQ